MPGLRSDQDCFDRERQLHLARGRRWPTARHRREPRTIIEPVSRAARSFCRECVGKNAAEVARCSAPEFPLWPYRMGGGRRAEEVAETG